jgi:hypothetical protein
VSGARASIIGRRRSLPGHRRAPRSYTLACEEPVMAVSPCGVNCSNRSLRRSAMPTRTEHSIRRAQISRRNPAEDRPPRVFAATVRRTSYVQWASCCRSWGFGDVERRLRPLVADVDAVSVGWVVTEAPDRLGDGDVAVVRRGDGDGAPGYGWPTYRMWSAAGRSGRWAPAVGCCCSVTPSPPRPRPSLRERRRAAARPGRGGRPARAAWSRRP